MPTSPNPHPATESEDQTAADSLVRQLFGIPLLAVGWPDCEELNRSLKDLVLDLESQEPSVGQSNHGGWQSQKNLQTLGHPAIRKLLSWIDIGVYMISSHMASEEVIDALEKKWTVSLWANVNRAGHFNHSHYHVGGFWSGVYYVSLGGVDENGAAGALGFHCPHQAGTVASNTEAPRQLQQAFQQTALLPPQPGLMVIFPSWLEHWVNPHSSREPRLSIAFDVAFPKEA